jgi:hypothetical protein
LKYSSNLINSNVEKYVLSEEVDYCLDGLAASNWEKDIEVQLTKG